jgi:hypothetical protein
MTNAEETGLTIVSSRFAGVGRLAALSIKMM